MTPWKRRSPGTPGPLWAPAPMAYVLWDRFLKHNPKNPAWPDRDRFILSAGHASALLYSLLYLTGYDLPLEEVMSFRQWGSKTPGHPEHGLTPGVEATTGPLGQGFANGVGMAIAERWLASNFNRPGHEIIDHHTYAIVSDGDLMEGISAEAASLAGHLGLGKLVYLYDDNHVSIEGHTDLAFSEDVGQRFRAYGWHVVGPVDGMDVAAVESAIGEAREETGKPSLVISRTTIGFGSPNKAGTAAVHGEPLGTEEARLAKEALGWAEAQPFEVPSEALAHFRQALEWGSSREGQWKDSLEAYRQAHPDLASQLEDALQGRLPEGWDAGLEDVFASQEKPIATREASGRVMNALAERVGNLIGGSADLAPSTKTLLNEWGHFSAKEQGRNLHFGVREHAMGAVSNGIALHGGLVPYTATFLIFSDYMRPPIRLASLMSQRVVFVFTHDSVGLGEDGPTHQPIEQLLGLRGVPNLVVIRPADALETAEAWKSAIQRHDGPTAIILSRQNLPVLDRSRKGDGDVPQGGYVVWEAAPEAKAVLIATGSEVDIAMQAGKLLDDKGIAVRVVSLPSWELFDSQPDSYRNAVLPPSITARVSIEASSPLGWERYVGPSGTIIGIPHFRRFRARRGHLRKAGVHRRAGRGRGGEAADGWFFMSQADCRWRGPRRDSLSSRSFFPGLSHWAAR